MKTMKLMQRFVVLYLSWSALMLQCVSGMAVLETTCAMDLVTTSSMDYSASQIFGAETELSSLFESILMDTNLMTSADFQVKKVSVLINSMTNQSITGTVSAIYVSEGNKALELDIEIKTILRREPSLTDKLSFAPANITLSPVENDTLILGVLDDDSRSPADKGLIVATFLLSLMLIIVSSVLLKITGGWKACKHRCNNVLFEEIEDEPALNNKETFQVQSFDERDHSRFDRNVNDHDEEDPSDSESQTTNATGVLGATYSHDSNPAAGLGIKTPSRGNGNYYDDDGISEMTPTPQHTRPGAPLGITSMRKMPPPESPEVAGGLANIIMGRFTGGRKRRDPN